MSTRFLRAAACAAVAALWLSTPARARAATYYTFKAAANGSYMCAENYGKDPLVAAPVTSSTRWPSSSPTRAAAAPPPGTAGPP